VFFEASFERSGSLSHIKFITIQTCAVQHVASHTYYTMPARNATHRLTTFSEKCVVSSGLSMYGHVRKHAAYGI
jgi:hypothetical protein